MSSPAPEASSQGPPARSGGGGKMGVWSKKMGPLPAWGWGAVGLAIVLVYMYWKNKNSAGASTASTAGSSAAAGTTGAAQIPEFVNQTYTTVTPPTATTPAATPAAPASSVIPGHHVITSTGKETLAQIATQYGTTPADIVAFTKSHKAHQSPTETKFFSKPTGTVPKGIVLWVPEPQVTNVTGGGGGQS